MQFREIEPEAFVRLLNNGELQPDCVVDVREQEEWDYYHLEQSVLMPMNTVPARLEELPRDRELYIVCAHGVRSAMVCGYLQQNGFAHAINVQGGMAAVSAVKDGFQYD